MSRAWVQISAGRGPIEVRRFVARLAERMEALCRERGLAVVDVTVHGDEGAPGGRALERAGPDRPGRANTASSVETHSFETERATCTQCSAMASSM
ncbi:hypothetical protein ACMHYB_49645 [Sorangium sp. So ce1128]